MGDNLTIGILKNIEKLATQDVEINTSILTGINKTNTLISDEIGKELKTQSKLLTSILDVLRNKSTVEFSLFQKTDSTVSLANMLTKSGAKNLEKTANALDLFITPFKRFVILVNEINLEKWKTLDVFFKTDTKIKSFAIAVAASAPLLLIGSVITMPIMYAWVLFFDYVSKKSKDLENGTKTLLYLAGATALITLSVVMASFVVENDPMKLLYAFGVVGGSLLLVALTFWGISKIEKSLNEGALTMLYLAGVTALVTSIVVLASYSFGNEPMNLLYAFGIVGGSLLLIGGAFILMGLAKGDISKGAIAMLMASASVLVLVGAVYFFTKTNITWEQIGMLGAVIFGVGSMMALAGLFALPIALGAGAMFLSGVSLIPLVFSIQMWSETKITNEHVLLLGTTIYEVGTAVAKIGILSMFVLPGALVLGAVSVGVILFTVGLQKFKDAKWKEEDTTLLTKTLETTLTSFVNIFDKIGIKKIYKSLLGAKLLGELGNSLGQLASGLSAFANGQEPTYEVKNGQLVLVGTKSFGSDLGQRVGDTIKTILTPLVDSDSVLYKLGKDDFLKKKGPVGEGINLLGKLGNSLSNFASGLNSFANGQEPTYEVKNGQLVLVGTKPLGLDLGQRVGNAIKALLTPLVDSDSVLYKLGEDEGVFWKGPVGEGINLLGKLGNSLSNFAKGIQAWAELKIPIYGKNDKGELVITGYDKLDADYSTKVGTNIESIIKALTEPLEKLGDKSGTFFDTDLDDGLEIISNLGTPFLDLAKSVEILSKLNLDSDKISKFITGTVGSFVDVLSTDKIQKIDNNKSKNIIDGLSTFSGSISKLTAEQSTKVGDMFVTMKKSINEMDLTKLNKLNDLAKNLSEFAKNMKGSFKDLEQVLTKLKEVVTEMNGVKINTSATSVPMSVSPLNNNKPQLDLTPLLDELESIRKVLMSGIDVEIKNESLFKTL